MIDQILPEGLEPKKKAALVLAGVSVIVLGIGVFIIKAGEFESKVRISGQTVNSAASSSGDVWVDVTGAVNSPGVYRLALGSRIKDAIEAAGGLSEDVDGIWVGKNLNRAQIITDGYKLYLPSINEANITHVNSDNSSVISINYSTKKELESLPGIGPVTADKIINNRPYMRVEELIEKKIVGEKVWTSIKDMIQLW